MKHLRFARIIDEAIQELCHDRPEENRISYCDGCDEQQRQLFGTCRTDELRKEIEYLRMVAMEGGARIG